MTLLCYPVLPVREYVVWDGCAFLDPAYLAAEKSQHPGIDLNLRTGGDSDLGQPVYSVAEGTVTHAKYHRVWGNVVVVYHPALGVWTQYAHLHDIRVIVGQRLEAGHVLGGIGKGGTSPQYPKGRYHAHLHFEVRTVDLPGDEWPSATMGAEQAAQYIRRTRKSPVRWLEELGAVKTLEELRPPVPAPPPPPTPAGPVYIWAAVRNGDGSVRPGEVVSIPVSADGRLLVQADGRPKIYRVPDSRLAEREV